VIAVLVQFTIKLHPCIKPKRERERQREFICHKIIKKRFDVDIYKTEADFYGCLAPT